MSDKVESMTLKPGMVVNGYLIERELGRGAMAVVYLTRQLDLDRPVALKVMSSEFALKKDYVRRFFNEVRTAAALSHPNIIQAYDAGVAFNNTYYFAMEYVEGESMLRRIERLGAIPVAEALSYAREIASALDYGWQQKRFRHGDIKPENFMVQSNGHVKLADFGLAMVKGHEYQGNEVMLTPHYAAPELIRGLRPADSCQSDIYAFGASLYHMLSGATPYPGNDAREVMRAHLTKKLEPLHQRCPEVPFYLSDFVSELMEKDTGRRIPDWKMVLSGIEAVAARYGISSGMQESEEDGQTPEARTLRHNRQVLAHSYRKYHRRKVIEKWTKCCAPLLVFLLFLAGLLIWQSARGERSSSEVKQSLTGGTAVAVSENLGRDEQAVSEREVYPAVIQENAEGRGGTVSGEEKKKNGEKIADGEDSSDGESGLADDSLLKTVPVRKCFALDREIEDFIAVHQEDVPDAAPSQHFSCVLPDGSIPLPDAGEMQEGLFITELQMMLRQFKFEFGNLKGAETLQMTADQWKKNHPSARGLPGLIIQYILQQMGPLLEAYPAYLVRLEPLLRQTRIYSRNKRNIWYQVLQVQLDGVILEQYFPKGRLRLPLKNWAQLQQEGILRNLLIQAYRKDVNADRALRLFHYFLFREEFTECRTLLREVPRQYRLVLSSILSLYALNSRERRSLSHFQEILQARKLGSRALLGKLLNMFQYQNTSIVKRNQKLVEFWQRECRMWGTGNAGADLISEAMKCSAARPEHAVDLLLRAEGVYPGKYPEAGMIREVYAQIARTFKKKSVMTPEKAGCPFRDFSPVKNHYSRRMALELLPGEKNSSAEFYVHMVQAESGLGRKEFLAEANLPKELERWTVGWLFARAVYDICLMKDDSRHYFRDFLLKSPEKAESSGYLLMECLLLTHRNTLYSSDYNLNLYDFLKRINPEEEIMPHYLRFWKLSLAVKLECQQKKEVIVNLEDFFHRFEGMEGKISERSRAVLTQMGFFHRLLRLSGKDRSRCFSLFLKKYPDASCEDMRLVLACCGRASLDAGAEADFLSWYERVGRMSDFLAGNILYDYLLRRISYELSRGNAAAGVRLTNRFSQCSSVHLWLYFARMQFLKAGLLSLGNSSGSFMDAASLLQGAEWASSKEQGMIHVTADYQSEIRSAGVGNYLCFWEDWLKACLQISRNQTGALDFSIGKDAMKAEAVLMEGLHEFFNYRTSSRKIIWVKEY